MVPKNRQTVARPRYIREDSQRDVWLKGDLPSSTYTINDKNKRYRIDGEYIRGFGYDKNLYISPGGIKNYRSTITINFSSDLRFIFTKLCV